MTPALETPSPDEPDLDAPRQLRRLGWKDLLQSVVGLVAAGLLVAFGLPHLLDTSWEAIGVQLARVGADGAILMALLLIAGLFCYTWVLIGSLPGLRHWPALKINAVTSLVSNVMPLGGPLGLGLAFVMFRTWGFSRRAISSSLMVSGLWNLMARMLLPVIGALVLVAGPIDAPQLVVRGAWLAGLLGGALVTGCLVVLYSDRAARGLSVLVHRAVAPFSKRGRLRRRVDHLVNDQRERILSVVKDGWGRMSLGMAGMFVLLFCMYWVAARSVGLDLPITELMCAFAFRQLLTLLAVTPGGLGITEVGTAGMLVLLGGDPGAASATALLYAFYAHVIVIPFGVGALALWWRDPARHAISTA